MSEQRLTGRIARESIRLMQVPRPDAGIVDGFRALGDATGIVCDVMDELGIAAGAVGAHILRPTMPGRAIVGPALTVRNIAPRADALQGAQARVNRMGEHEAHNLTTPGDVLVIDGVSGCSNLGGMSAQIGKRQGQAGAIVWGGVRDVGHSRGVDYPVWSSEVTPATGKWRLQTVEINGPVVIGGVRVEPGDLVIADDTGVVFVPRTRMAEVLKIAQEKHKAEEARCKVIDSGVSVPDLQGKKG